MDRRIEVEMRREGGRSGGRRGERAWEEDGYIVARKIDVQMRHHVITSTKRERYLTV